MTNLSHRIIVRSVIDDDYGVGPIVTMEERLQALESDFVAVPIENDSADDEGVGSDFHVGYLVTWSVSGTACRSLLVDRASLNGNFGP